MWSVYTGEQYRAALEEWDRDEVDPDSCRSDRYRQACYNDEAVAVADCVETKLREGDRPLPVLVLVGAGGNGRAGLRAGIELLSRGYRVEVVLVPAPQEGDREDGHPDYCEDPEAAWRKDATPAAHELLGVFLRCGGVHSPRYLGEDTWRPYLAVDAICGRGFEGRLKGAAAQWAGRFWEGSEVVAVDCPTGMHPDTGKTRELIDAEPALGGFTAATTVVTGGFRPVHVLRNDCGRLVYLRGGTAGALRKTEYDHGMNREYLDFFDDYGYLPVRERHAFIAQDPQPDERVPAFTAYSADADGEGVNSYEGCVQIPGMLAGPHHDRTFAEWMRNYSETGESVPTVGITGVPPRRPGAPVLAAAGAVSSLPCRIVADDAASATLVDRHPGVEVVPGDTDPDNRSGSWILTSAQDDLDVSDVQKLVVTGDTVRDWIAAGQRPPREPDEKSGQQIVLVVDGDTAEHALSAWGNGDADPDVVDAVTLAEALSSCTGTSVVLVGATVVFVWKTDTWIVRTGVDAQLQGIDLVFAGAVAATLSVQTRIMNPYVPMAALGRALVGALRKQPAVALTAMNVVEELPEAIRALRASADDVG